MSEIIDLIYEVFDQIEQAKLLNDTETVIEKEKELDILRSKLVKNSSSKGTHSNFLYSTKKVSSKI